MIGVLKPTLQQEMGWTEGDFATIVFWFQVAYAIGYIGFARIVDIVGARLGYAVALTIWTISHMAPGLATRITQLAVARFGLGLGHSGHFPARLRAVHHWTTDERHAANEYASMCRSGRSPSHDTTINKTTTK